MPAILHFAGGDTLAVEQDVEDIGNVIRAEHGDIALGGPVWHPFDVMGGTEIAEVRLDQVVAIRSYTRPE